MLRPLFYFVLLPALLPVFILIVYIYKKDSVEREPLGMIAKVFAFGALFSLIDIPLEAIASAMLAAVFPYGDIKYEFASNFFGVALIEELTKFAALKLCVWKNKNFNYKFDGIVYAASASLGFAALENILYVINYGTGVALGRALFAIPGHAAFGIFMGFFFARAKHFSLRKNAFAAFFFMLLAVAVPVFVHGLYDFLLSPAAEAQNFSANFFTLVLAIDVAAWLLIRHESRTDRPL